jgi:hypothetical protein
MKLELRTVTMNKSLLNANTSSAPMVGVLSFDELRAFHLTRGLQRISAQSLNTGLHDAVNLTCKSYLGVRALVLLQPYAGCRLTACQLKSRYLQD